MFLQRKVIAIFTLWIASDKENIACHYPISFRHKTQKTRNKYLGYWRSAKRKIINMCCKFCIGRRRVNSTKISGMRIGFKLRSGNKTVKFEIANRTIILWLTKGSIGSMLMMMQIAVMNVGDFTRQRICKYQQMNKYQ